MKATKIVAILGIIAMSAALIYGFSFGNFFEDGALIVANPWGIVSLVDLYTGFTIFGLWIYYRESNKLLALVYIVALMILGFWLASVYLLKAAIESKGSYTTLLMGKNKSAK